MSAADQPEFAVSRVVAALDATSHGVDTLRAAVELAARLRADVAGLFIEDTDLLRLFELPVTRHVGTFAGDERPAAEQIGRHLRRVAEEAETALKEAALGRGLAWSFDVARGSARAELVAHTHSGDIVVVGGPSSIAGVPPQLGSKLHQAVWLSARCALHVAASPVLHRPIAAVQSGSALTRRTLDAALRIAEPSDRGLDVILFGHNSAAARARDEVKAWLEGRGYHPRFLAAGASLPNDLAKLLLQSGGNLLVVSADVLDLDAIQDRLLPEECSLMIVR